MAMFVTYFYSGAVISTMTDGTRKERHFDGSITVEPDISVDDVIYEIKSKHSYRNTKAAHVRQMNRV